MLLSPSLMKEFVLHCIFVTTNLFALPCIFSFPRNFAVKTYSVNLLLFWATSSRAIFSAAPIQWHTLLKLLNELKWIALHTVFCRTLFTAQLSLSIYQGPAPISWFFFVGWWLPRCLLSRNWQEPEKKLLIRREEFSFVSHFSASEYGI